jgi:hypothetical protein
MRIVVDDNKYDQLLSDDPFWAAIEAQFGPVALARRKSLEAVRLLSQARSAYLRATDDGVSNRALELAIEVLNAAEIGADEDFMEHIVRSYRPEPRDGGAIATGHAGSGCDLFRTRL